MDSLSIRTSYWNKKLVLDKIKLTLTGYSRAAYRTGFYIPELGIMLDAGPQNFNKPSHIFITHAHADHVAELPFTMILDGDTDHCFHLYGPENSKNYVSNYIRSMFEMNALQLIDSVDDWYQYSELIEGNTLDLVIKKKKIHIRIIKCDHSVETISYLFDLTKSKLNSEYVGMNAKDIIALKKAGTQITQEISEPLFAYICDCSSDTIHLEEKLWSQYPYVIMECTFLYDDHKESAEKTKHVFWGSIKPLILKHPEITFILIHFSLRYRDSEISEFFLSQKIDNVICWV